MTKMMHAGIWLMVVGTMGCGEEVLESADPGSLERWIRDCDPVPTDCPVSCSPIVDLFGDEDACFCPDPDDGVFGRTFHLVEPLCSGAAPDWQIQPGEDDCVPSGCVVYDS